MPGEPKRLEHPNSVYIIGFIFKIITLSVLIGVVYQITLSPHGPQLLVPLQQKIEAKQKSLLLEEVKRQEEYEQHRHFHHMVSAPQLPQNMQSVCYICHSDYPHSKNKKVRAMLNMHTQFFLCETCHIQERTGVSIVYKWHNPIDEEAKGPFFGTNYDPDTGNLVEVEDQFSKIAPFFKSGSQYESVIQTQDEPTAQDYLKIRDKLTPEQRDNAKKKFHVNIKPKGHDCKKCHDQRGILDFKKLGFSENRIVDLEQLNIAGMITKYEKFYIPNLFSDTGE